MSCPNGTRVARDIDNDSTKYPVAPSHDRVPADGLRPTDQSCPLEPGRTGYEDAWGGMEEAHGRASIATRTGWTEVAAGKAPPGRSCGGWRLVGERWTRALITCVQCVKCLEISRSIFMDDAKCCVCKYELSRVFNPSRSGSLASVHKAKGGNLNIRDKLVPPRPTSSLYSSRVCTGIRCGSKILRRG